MKKKALITCTSDFSSSCLAEFLRGKGCVICAISSEIFSATPPNKA